MVGSAALSWTTLTTSCPPCLMSRSPIGTAGDLWPLPLAVLCRPHRGSPNTHLFCLRILLKCLQASKPLDLLLWWAQP